MKLPAGTEGSVVINSQKEGMLQYLMAFKGAIMIDSGSGRGFILTRNGELIAAYFKDKHGVYRGTSALQNLMAAPGSDTGLQQQNFTMRVYSDEDFAEALELCIMAGCSSNPSYWEITQFPLRQRHLSPPDILPLSLTNPPSQRLSANPALLRSLHSTKGFRYNLWVKRISCMWQHVPRISFGPEPKLRRI